MEQSSGNKHSQVISAPIMKTYGRFETVFVNGDGALLFDDSGREYIDCLAGIAVVSAGHANSFIADAVNAQMRRLVHVSNLFWNEPMARLAYKLQNSTGGWGRVFFANSGAEANESAIKLVRKWAGPKRFKILCAEGSFHGRTLGALAATGQPLKWKGFEPLPAGFIHLPFNDFPAFEEAVDSETAAIMLEPIQGERGVVPASKDFLPAIRDLCTKKNIALIFDEVQSGMGRTGKWWAFQNYGIKPDIFTTAKALANGLPMGACIADEPFASSFTPGDHASTFGGGAVAAVAAEATMDYLLKENLIEAAEAKGELFKSLLSSHDKIKEVRGMGLMLGAVLKEETAQQITSALLEAGVIVNAVMPDVIRITPPLVITEAQIRSAVEKFNAALN